MMTRLIARITATVAALTVAAGVFLPSPDAAAVEPAPYTVSVSVSATMIQTGSKLTVRGSVTPPVGKVTAYIQHRLEGSTKWKTVAKVKLSKAGKFTKKVKVTGTTDRTYRVYVPAKGGRAKLYSEPTGVVDVTPKVFTVTAKLSASTVTAGANVTVTGKATPYAKKSKTVHVQVRPVGGSWKTVAKVKVAKSGKFTAKYTAKTAGTFEVRAYKPKYGSRKAGYSPVLTLTVNVKAAATPAPTPAPTATVAPATPKVDSVSPAVMTTTPGRTSSFKFTGTHLDQVVEVTIGSSSTRDLLLSGSKWLSEGTLFADLQTQEPGTYEATLETRDGKQVSAGTVTFRAPGDTGAPAEPTQPAEPQAKLASVSPSSGPLAGGGTVTLAGPGLSSTQKVLFHSLSVDASLGKLTVAATVTSKSADKVTVRVPAGIGGPARIEVVTGTGSVFSDYTYQVVARAAGSFEKEVVALINERRASGWTCTTTPRPSVPPLAWDGKLGDLALAHANDLTGREALYGYTISHTTLTSTGRTVTTDVRAWYAGWPLSTQMGEVIADMGPGRTAKQLVDGWFSSPSHCGALMNARFSAIGLGQSARADGGLVAVANMT